MGDRLISCRGSENATPHLTPLEWDSAHFGFKIARLETSPNDSMRRVRAALGEAEAQCVIARIPHLDMRRAGILEDAGFRLMDILVLLEIDASAFSRPLPRSNCELRGYVDSDLPILREISRKAFSTGHFRADRGFDQRKVDELYALWLEKCVREHCDISVAASHARPVGFVAGSGQGGTSIIELVAVDCKMRSKGIGYDLLSHFVDMVRGRFRVVKVGVHLDNISALRLYELFGFAAKGGILTFHCWRK